MKNNDGLNGGYLSHNILFKFYRIIDFIGYKIFRRRQFKKTGNRLLFINLGLIGDLILFRYVIDDFLKLDYQVDILIQNEYKFLFEDLYNVNIITVKNYKDKKILLGFIKILSALINSKKKYDISCHFRGYLGTGIFSTFLSRVANNSIGYGTSGFGFLLNKRVEWLANTHETNHILSILQVLEPSYNSINVDVFDVMGNNNLFNKFGLIKQQYIIIHPTSQNVQKNIPQAMLNCTLKYLLENSSLKVVFVGVINEISYVRECLDNIDLSRVIITNGEIGLFDVRFLVANAVLLIGIDSSIAHLSSALKLPKIILWHRLNSFTQWKPLGDNFIIINEWSNDLALVNAVRQLNKF